MMIRLIGISFLLVSAFVQARSALAQSVLPSLEEYRQVQASGVTLLGLNIDNDSLLLKRDDGFYTSGNQLVLRTVWNSSKQSIAYGWHLGQDLYTASDIKLSAQNIQAVDHPYAGWLYLGAFKEISDAAGRGGRLAIELGCLGPCAGGARTQASLHRFLNQPLPQGWSTQLQQEWGLVLSGEWSPGRWVAAPSLDFSPRLKARFGNIFTDVSVDANLRLGQLNTMPQQSANYVFLRGEIKAIGYDATLQGGYFARQALGATLQRNVGELELGYQWHNGRYGLSASVLRRSSEIKQLSNAIAAQNFARLQFNYAL